MWLPGPSVAVVTGANQGIGYQIVKDLVQFYDGTVYLTCRNETAGLEAAESINFLYSNETIPTKRYYQSKIKVHKVDVTNPETVKNFSQHITTNHGGVNILINNAAVHLDTNPNLSYLDKVNQTLETNYFGLLRMCHLLFPLLRQSARVVHVTSSVGHVSILNSTKLREQFLNENMTETDLSNLMNEYLEDVKHGRHIDKGWPESPYAVSKVGTSKLAMIQQKYNFHNRTKDIIVNAVNPGYAQTRMSNYTGLMEADEAVDPVWYAAMLQQKQREPKGRLVWNNKEIVTWDENIPKIFDHPSKSKQFLEK